MYSGGGYAQWFTIEEEPVNKDRVWNLEKLIQDDFDRYDDVFKASNEILFNFTIEVASGQISLEQSQILFQQNITPLR